MYELRNRKEFNCPTVADVREALKNLPSDMKMYCCGEDAAYLHIGYRDNMCSFDTDSLDEYYENEKQLNTEKGLIEAVFAYGIASGWTDNAIARQLFSMGIKVKDFNNAGKGDWLKSDLKGE